MRLQNEIKKLLEGCDHFIGLVPGEHGVPEIIASDNLKQHRFLILGDAYENFARYMSSRELASVTRMFLLSVTNPDTECR